jgi:D-alanine-D-alanine ligase
MKIPFGIQRGIQKIPLIKIDKYIEIVGSSNPRLNAMAEDAQLSILATLRKLYAKVAITIVDDMADLERLVAKQPDFVVLGMKFVLLDPSKGYDHSPRMWLPSYLKENNIDCTGSHTDALTLEHNKHEAKQKVMDAGLQSTAYFIAKVSQPIPTHKLKFPLFVKPINSGDSMGIDEKSVVYSEIELESKILSIHADHGLGALVEEYLPGREFSVAVIGRPDSDDLLALPVEITTPADKQGNSILSSAVKKADSERILAIDNPELKNTLNALAIGVFKALGSRDYGRIDMRLNALGRPSFIEANLMPGLSNHGYLSKCFYINDRIQYEDMILSIIDLCLQRSVIHLPAVAAKAALHNDPASPRLAGAGLIV